MIIDFPWYFVLLCLLAGAVYAAALYAFGRRPFARWLLWLLSVLRFVAVSAIVFLLLAPVSRQKVSERQRPRVAFLDDASLSVGLSADSSFSLAALHDDMDDRLDVTYETFGNQGATDIGEALMRHRYDDMAAVVIATDGIYNRGSNPPTLAEQLGCPVYTIALGDTSLHRDATLTDLRASRITMLGNNFPVEVTVAATLLNGNSATLTIADAQGRQHFSQRLEYDNNNFSATASATITTDKPGLQRYTAHLSVAGGETTAENNTMTFYVDVIDTRRHVAIFANAPHPDIAALKHSVEANPYYDATVVYADGVKKTDTAYSLAILHNLPSATHPDISFAKDLPQLYIIGLQTDLARFNALHSGLDIASRVKRSNEITAVHQPAFSLFSLDDASVAAIEAMPPLAAPFGEGSMAAGTQALFTARLGNIDTRQPLVAASSNGELRKAFVWGEGLWRWRLADWQASSSHEHFDRLVSQLVAFTAMQQQRNRLQVETERSYATGETPVVRAQLYNEAYELTNTPDATFSLSGDSVKAEFQFARDGQSYRLALPDLPQGLYHYTATADGVVATGSFAVEALNLEQRRLVADHNLLRSISSTTGGATYRTDQIDELKEQLLALKPTIYTHTRYAELLHLPLVLTLVILVLAAEWVLRKYHGEL